MTDQEIVDRLHLLVRQDRRITQEIIDLIVEAEKRKIFARRAYPSVYEWLIGEFGFSRAAAYRRVQAARLVRDVPAAKEKMLMGDLNLTTVAQLQSAVRKEEKRIGEQFDSGLKRELVAQIEQKTPEQAAKIIAAHFPEVVVKKESLRAVGTDHTRLVVTLEDQDARALKEVHALLSHSCQSLSQVVTWLVKDYLKRKDPMRKKMTQN